MHIEHIEENVRRTVRDMYRVRFRVGRVGYCGLHTKSIMKLTHIFIYIFV
jgi:hypothetical protein